jgi:hypothetical protein
MARQSPRFKQQPNYLVICEDSKSSRTYLNEAFNYNRVNNYIYADHIGSTDPLNIVSHAVKAYAKYDKFFCVIDRDNHENFAAAIHKAASYPKIKMIVSYPCYEFWFCLHIGYTRKGYTHAGNKSAADQLIADLCKSHTLFTDYSKGKIDGLFKKIITEHKVMYENAFTYAERVLLEIAKDGEPNPSTQIYQLLNVIPTLLKPQAIT